MKQLVRIYDFDYSVGDSYECPCGQIPKYFRELTMIRCANSRYKAAMEWTTA